MNETTRVSTIEHDSAAVGLEVDFQSAIELQDYSSVPAEERFTSWAQRAYAKARSLVELPQLNEVTIRIVTQQEITELNSEFRNKPTPTNVLSFPFDVPEGLDIRLLGDVVICHDVVIAEALAESKSVQNHYAHMTTHGILHLCGFDHQCDKTAEQMEALEVQILAESQVPNPYEITV